MPIDFILPLSMVFALTAWTLIFLWYVHPALHGRGFGDVMRPLILLHCFRYIGLMFLIPGVTVGPLDARFALPAAYGDLIAAVLAFVALVSLRQSRAVALTAVWIFNGWGLVDLLNAVARGIVYTPDGALGASFWIPSLFVPPLLVSHGYIFWYLMREGRESSKVGKVPRPIEP